MQMRGSVRRFLALCAIAAIVPGCGRHLFPPPPPASELVGTEVMIAFEWSEPSSVLESLLVVGTLVRVEDEFSVVDIRRSVRNDYQRAQIDALERHGKLVRGPDGETVLVRRGEVADLRPYSPPPVATTR